MSASHGSPGSEVRGLSVHPHETRLFVLGNPRLTLPAPFSYEVWQIAAFQRQRLGNSYAETAPYPSGDQPHPFWNVDERVRSRTLAREPLTSILDPPTPEQFARRTLATLVRIDGREIHANPVICVLSYSIMY